MLKVVTFVRAEGENEIAPPSTFTGALVVLVPVISRRPPFTTMPPVNVLAPVRARRPFPCLRKLPAWLGALARAWLIVMLMPSPTFSFAPLLVRKALVSPLI